MIEVIYENVPPRYRNAIRAVIDNCVSACSSLSDAVELADRYLSFVGFKLHIRAKRNQPPEIIVSQLVA